MEWVFMSGRVLFMTLMLWEWENVLRILAFSKSNFNFMVVFQVLYSCVPCCIIYAVLILSRNLKVLTYLFLVCNFLRLLEFSLSKIPVSLVLCFSWFVIFAHDFFFLLVLVFCYAPMLVDIIDRLWLLWFLYV